MSSTASPHFDVYYKWLGIPPAEQPPNYYRLLGVALYEPDADVIAAAADRQMGHVKSFATGRYASQSQELLNELARARVTLLNANRKAEYDRRLLKQLEAPDLASQWPDAAATAQHASTPALTASHVGTLRSAELPHLGEMSRHAQSRQYGRGRSPLAAPLIASVIAISAVGAATYYASRTRSSIPVADQTAQKPIPPAVFKRRLPEPNTQRGAPNYTPPSPPLKPPEQNSAKDAPPAKSPKKSSAPLMPNIEKKAPTEKASLLVDLNLDNQRQRHSLDAKLPRKLRVLGLQGCEATYELHADAGDLDARSGVSVLIRSVREVTLRVSLDVNSSGRRIALIDYRFTDSKGDERPFTIRSLDRAHRDIVRQGDREVALVEDMQAERDRLQAWIAAPVLKPLAERNRAKARVLELGVLITEQQPIISALEADLAVAQPLRDLAYHLHEDCHLEIVAAE